MSAFALIAIAALVTIPLVAYLSYRAKQQRIQAFAAMANQLGLTFAVHDPFGTLGEPFKLFERGDGRGVENVMSGSWQGREVRAFDYWFYEEHTDAKGHTSRSYYRFDCALMRIEAACSPITIEPENLLTRLADHLAMHDIEFESESFNEAFNVKSPDHKFANDLIDARMMDWLLRHGEGFSFEIVGDRFLCFCRRIDPEAFVTLLGTAKGFHDQVPSVVASLYPLNRSR